MSDPAEPSEPVWLDAVLITDQLHRRPARPPDHAAEAGALAELAQTLAEAPHTLLQKLVELALKLCRADSAGVSLLEADRRAFRWPAVAGAWAAHAGTSLPRNASPCGVVIDRNAPLLFRNPGRHFPDVAAVTPPLVEVLLVPFHVGGEPAGTVWANAHTPDRKFDAEDLRLLTVLSRVAAVHQKVVARHEAEDKRAGEALRASAKRLELALVAARMGIWTLDATTGTQMRDANLNGLLGLEPTETVQPFEEFLAHVHPEDRETVRAAFAASIRERKPLNTEFRVVRPDGAVRWLRDQGDVFHTSGAPLMAGACVDVTERREAEDALRRSEERVRLIFSSATDFAIFTLDPNRIVTDWNPGAEATFGYAAGEMVGRSGDVLFTPEDRAAGAPEAEAETAPGTGARRTSGGTSGRTARGSTPAA